jgi:cardiolipin synthase
MLTIPNLLTLLRLLLAPCFIGAAMRGNHTLAFILFVTAAVTDIFDGVIARRLNQRSRLGAFLDPAADKLLMVSGFLYYTVAELPRVRIPMWLTYTVFIRDVLLVFFAYLLYTRVNVKAFPPTWLGKTSTVLQAVTLSAAVAVNAFLPQLLGFAEVLFRLALAITIASAFQYMRRADRTLNEGLAARA